MPWSVAAGVLGSGAGAAVSGAMSPSTSGGGSAGPSSYYVPSGLQNADQAWQNLLTQSTAQQGGIMGMLPYYQGAFQGGINAGVAYGPGYQNAANTAGNQYTNLATTLSQQGGQNLGIESQLIGAGMNLYNMGLDPQNALYNRTVQQLQDQTGATNSMYGLGSSAAGAGVANQALSNFNIDWQNNQLSRALQGLQGYAGAANTAGRFGELGTTQLSAVPGYTLQGGQLPYTTAQGIAALPGQLAGTYASQIEAGPLASASSIQGQIIPYLNYGAGAQSVPFQAQSQGAGALGSAVSQGISGIGSAVQNSGGWGNFFGGTTGSFGGGDFSGAFNASPYYSGGGNQYGFTLQ
jgi:hypothetical protein